MIGCHVRLRVVSEIKSHNILTEGEWQSSGINITPSTITMTILRLKLSKATNSIFSTQISWINRRRLSTIWKLLRVLITALSSSRQDHHTKILHSRYREGSGTSLKNQALRASFTREFFSCILISKSQNSEFDCA